MAPATTDKHENAMATDIIAAGANEPGDNKPRGAPPTERMVRSGFFHVYKPGQGYWTRMGTIGAALLIAGLTCHFLYQHLPVWLTPLYATENATQAQALRTASMARNTTIAIIAGFLVLYSLLVFWLTNKPANADFLIATDSEMKKVNWTSRKELIGSTKVVIIFMFLIAFMLFGFDVIFGYLFYFLTVLKSRPF